MRRCPHCGTENVDDNRYCITCGTSLTPSAAEAGPVGSLPRGPISVGQEPPPPEPSLPQDAFAGTPETGEPPAPAGPAPWEPAVPAAEEPLPAPGVTPGAYPEPPLLLAPPPMPSRWGTDGPAAPQQSQLALWSLIVGIASFAVCCGLGGVAAIVLGTLARKDTRATNQGMATAGIVLGIINVVIFVAYIVFVIVAAVTSA